MEEEIESALLCQGTVDGLVVGWADQHNPIIQLENGGRVHFDLRWLAATENGGEVPYSPEDCRVGDRIQVTITRALTVIRRGKGKTREEWLVEHVNELLQKKGSEEDVQ